MNEQIREITDTLFELEQSIYRSISEGKKKQRICELFGEIDQRISEIEELLQ